MEKLLKAIGYPASAIIVFLFMAYVWRKIFEKTLDVLMEDRKAEPSLVHTIYIWRMRSLIVASSNC